MKGMYRETGGAFSLSVHLLRDVIQYLGYAMGLGFLVEQHRSALNLIREQHGERISRRP